MILIFDENKFRLQKTVKRFNIEGFPTIGRDYEDYDYYTKPMITVLVCPDRAEIEHYMRARDTIYILVLKRPIPELKYARNVIIDPSAEVTIEQIKEIVLKEYNFNFKLDIVKCIAIDEEANEICFGGADLLLEKREYNIVRFFTYNEGKRFTIDEIFEYLNLQRKIKHKTFQSYVAGINAKCAMQNRESIILRNSYGYKLTHIVGHPSDKKKRRNSSSL